jgi:hypothetical protein
MLRKGSYITEQMWDVRGRFSGGRFPGESCYAKGPTLRNKCGTFVEDSPEGDSPENHVTQRVLHYGTNVRNFVEPNIDSPQNHAPRNLITQLSLYRGNMKGNMCSSKRDQEV